MKWPQMGMDSALGTRESFEGEGQKLNACEENLKRYHQLALAGRLVGATMHEVNNRLAALTNLIFLAKALAGSPDPAAEYLEEADLQLRGLGEITSRSLAFIRLEADSKEIDLVELARSALRLHEHQIAKKRIQVEIRSAESAMAVVRRGEIYQVLTNLLLNAIEVLPHSGNLHIRVACHSPNATITIADTGPGIPEIMRNTLFDSVKSERVDGNGLGLWIVREIVQSHGGKISYRSSRAQGKSGTVFRITLPTRAGLH